MRTDRGRLQPLRFHSGQALATRQPNSNKVLLSHTAVAADELARSFADSKIQHSLLIFDTSYSSEGSSDFAAKFARIIGGRRWYETHLRASA